MSETDPLLRARSNDRAIDIDDPEREEEAFQDVEFSSEECLDNPMNWPGSYKWGVIGLLAFMAFTVYVHFVPCKKNSASFGRLRGIEFFSLLKGVFFVLCWRGLIANARYRTFTCIGVVPVAGRIVLDLEGRESKSSSVLLVTIWELGEAAGPLVIAPLSEGEIGKFGTAAT